jgi:hypothetical protein|tara:strand:- start:267 stop:770 length:504 start_codon:yes stop_codon:yes gene_type:complete
MKEIIIRKESLYQISYTGNLETIEEQIRYIKKFDKGRIKSNRGGYQSNDITFGFDELILFITQSIKELQINANLGNFWLNINSGTDYNNHHIHGINDTISVVYYHKVCCNKAPISFGHLVPVLHRKEFQYFPANQDIIIFDDRIPHSVLPCNQDNHERISLGFNFYK